MIQQAISQVLTPIYEVLKSARESSQADCLCCSCTVPLGICIWRDTGLPRGTCDHVNIARAKDIVSIFIDNSDLVSSHCRYFVRRELQ